MTKWYVRYKGAMTPKIVEGKTFHDAVTEASKDSREIVEISYLMY
jgi:hypothetical protein